MVARKFFVLLLVAASWTAAAEPIAATATAHVGARIVAAPRVVETPELPSRVTLPSSTAAGLEVAVEVHAVDPRLSVATGDRDVERVEPSREGKMRVGAHGGTEIVEIVWHAE